MEESSTLSTQREVADEHDTNIVSAKARTLAFIKLFARVYEAPIPMMPGIVLN